MLKMWQLIINLVNKIVNGVADICPKHCLSEKIMSAVRPNKIQFFCVFLAPGS